MIGQGLKLLLSSDYDVVAIVRDGAQVVAADNRYHPDLLLLDLTMPNRSGLEVLDELRSIGSEIRVLVVTMHSDHIMMEACMALGAGGFILKDGSSDDLRSAVEEVLAGRHYVSSMVRKQGHHEGRRDYMGFFRLTPRQQKIVLLIARGLTSEQMAAELGVTHHTVHFHRKSIRKVLGFHTDLEMYRYAILAELSVSSPIA